LFRQYAKAGYCPGGMEGSLFAIVIEFYQDHSYDIPTFLSINTFLERNDIYGKDIVNVLRTANDVINLNQTILNLRGEIEKLKQTKNNYSLNQNLQPVPLGPLPRYYNW
jgi:hypothetical protein